MRTKRTQFLEFCRYLRPLHPQHVRIASICEIAYTPTNSSWINRIEAQFTALRYFTLNGTDHRSTKSSPA